MYCSPLILENTLFMTFEQILETNNLNEKKGCHSNSRQKIIHSVKNFVTARSKVRRTISFTLWTGRYILICRVVFCFYTLTSSYNLASSLSKRSGKYIVVRAISNILIITKQNFLHVCLRFSTYYRDSAHILEMTVISAKSTLSL